MAIMRVYVDAILRKADADLTQNHFEVGWTSEDGAQEVVDQYLTEAEANQWVMDNSDFAEQSRAAGEMIWPFMQDMQQSTLQSQSPYERLNKPQQPQQPQPQQPIASRKY
jgi:hypothetical protein